MTKQVDEFEEYCSKLDDETFNNACLIFGIISDISLEDFSSNLYNSKYKESEDKMKVGIVTCNFASLKSKYSKEYFEFVLDTCMEIIKSFVENDFIDITNEHVLLNSVQ